MGVKNLTALTTLSGEPHGLLSSGRDLFKFDIFRHPPPDNWINYTVAQPYKMSREKYEKKYERGQDCKINAKC